MPAPLSMPSTPKQSTPLVCYDLDDEPGKGVGSCRVCWEHDQVTALVSPCKCSGTQKHVHLECLRRWQENVQRRDAADERAFRCSVCRSLFSVPPRKPRGGGVALQALRGIAGALCISLLAFGLTGPPWPHLALLVLLLLGSRSHWLPGVALVVVGGLLATMHARGLRLILRLEDGGRLGLAVIRHGAPVPGVGAGVLLVASDGLEHSIFRRSVVLLTQHGRAGARGVILTQPMSHPPALPAGLATAAAAATVEGTAAAAEGEGQPAGDAAAAANSSNDTPGGAGGRGGAQTTGTADSRSGGSKQGGGAVKLRHFLGGPVGMPGEGVNHEVAVLHLLGGVAGARRILPPSHNDTVTAAGPGSASSSATGVTVGSSSDNPWLYEGGSLAEILERAADAAGADPSAAEQPQAQQRQPAAREKAGQQQQQEAAPAAPPAVLLFHGVCAWAEGQLEGELRAGSWGFMGTSVPDALGLLSLPPEKLWQALAGSPQLARAH